MIRLTLASEDNKSDKVKYAELNCLMTVCKLENSLHRFLILKKAKAVCKNIKNYITGINFLKKMISLEKEVILFLFSLLLYSMMIIHFQIFIMNLKLFRN